MSVADKVEEAVGAILPVYYGDSPENITDERYIIYDLVKKGSEYGAGQHHSAEYMVTLNIFSPRADFELYDRLEQAMCRAGFGFEGGGKVRTDDIFPYEVHWYQDYGFAEVTDV